jgi:hypothetical protein
MSFAVNGNESGDRHAPLRIRYQAVTIAPRAPALAAAARRACQGPPRLRGHRKGLALIGPSTVAC